MRIFLAMTLIFLSVILVSCSTPPRTTTPSLSEEQLEQRLIDARWNMIHLAGAFNTYNLNHDGPPPAGSWQQALIDEGLRTPEELISPASDGDSVEYILVPADELSFDRTQVLVYEDQDDHAELVVVMFHDLHVESISREGFELLADEQGFEIRE
ncbi:MAG: hypothetical protein ACI89L_000903 [Phycisphaerales bacterium]|jgi:hypothetical protein